MRDRAALRFGQYGGVGCRKHVAQSSYPVARRLPARWSRWP